MPNSSSSGTNPSVYMKYTAGGGMRPSQAHAQWWRLALVMGAPYRDLASFPAKVPSFLQLTFILIQGGI